MWREKNFFDFAPCRILVTGSRGKSSVVRMIHRGLVACGLAVRSRITGVVPRELADDRSRRIVRNGPGHVEEMRWWLRGIPRATEAIVMENSGVLPDLQGLAARWLAPTLVVWTNARADHTESWGSGREGAVRALARGVPDDTPLLLGAELSADEAVLTLLRARRGATFWAQEGSDYIATNAALSKRALEIAGYLCAESERAVDATPPDLADFRVFGMPLPGSPRLAAAFSANDMESTALLFSLLGWKSEETSLLYADRRDRAGRKKSFRPFIEGRVWREVRVLNGRETPDEIAAWAASPSDMPGKKIFGCGNVAGAPLALIESMLEGGAQWTIPRA